MFLLVIPVLAGVGWYVWNHQQVVRDAIIPEVEGVVDRVQTQVAPKPTPSATPDLALAQSTCLSADRLGNIEQAIVQCGIMAESTPNDPDLYYKVTHMLIISSNYGDDTARINQALEFAEKTINANPEAPHGWTIRAMALDWSGKSEQALASALHARMLDDSFAPTYAVLGSIYKELGKYDVAIGYLNEAITLDTSGLAVADAFYTLGNLYNDLGDREEAIRNYRAALQQAPYQTYIAVQLALTYLTIDEDDTAIEMLIETLEQNPGDPEVLWALGRAHFKKGLKERAYEYYRRCLDNDRDNVLCLSWLGGLYFYDADYATAISNLQRAIELGSQDPDDFYQIGLSLASMARCAEAIPYLQQGYNIVTEQERFDAQARFINALQDCGVVLGPVTGQGDTTEGSAAQ